MSVEQSDADSPSILERMESALSPERPEAAVKEEPEDAQPVETTEDDEPEQEEAPPEEFAEVTADDGTPVKIPAKLKDSFLRWDDYTKKTQTVQTLA